MPADENQVAQSPETQAANENQTAAESTPPDSQPSNPTESTEAGAPAEPVATSELTSDAAA